MNNLVIYEGISSGCSILRFGSRYSIRVAEEDEETLVVNLIFTAHIEVDNLIIQFGLRAGCR